jgi:ADP-heptose:LPS heptosyltransferase
MQKPTKALVLAAGSLGDCILTLPALQFLQSRQPVTVAGTFPFQELGASLLGVEKVVPLDPLLQSLYASNPSKDLWEGFSDVYLFFKESDTKLLESLARLSHFHIHQPSHSFSDFLQESKWAGEYWLQTVLPSGNTLGERSKHPHLQMNPEFKSQGTALCESLKTPNPFILHPGSGSRAKNAPLSFFRKAAEKTVSEAAKPVLVLWGEAEKDWLKEIQEGLGDIPGVKLLPEPLPLIQVAAILTQACGYLGNDSGITQLASACGAKTFAVFNSTDSRVWGPQEAFILQAMKTLYS